MKIKLGEVLLLPFFRSYKDDSGDIASPQRLLIWLKKVAAYALLEWNGYAFTNEIMVY